MINMLNQSTGRMRSTKTKSAILASLIVGAMSLPFIMPVQKAHADNDRHEDSDRSENSDALLGTWIVHVSVDPNTVPPGTPSSVLNFTQLDTFGAGGGFVESNNGPGAGQPPGQGNWVRTGRHQFATTQLRLGFDAAHNFTGFNKIRSTLTLNKKGDEFTESSQVDITLPNGTLLPFHPGATSHGVRMPIEPLN
jgi:hypothetical protein